MLLCIALTFFICALFGRLFYIQIIDSPNLVAKAQSQWLRDLPLKAARGKIYSSDNVVLSGNTNVFSIYVRPRAVTDANEVSQVLSEHLKLDKQKLYTSITTQNKSEITIARKVSSEVAESIKSHNLSGIYYTLDATRVYPFGNYLTQILGFTNVDNVGQNGLEGYYDKYLKGVDGFAYTETDLKGIELEANVTRYVQAIAGCDIYTGIDSSIQAFCEDAVTDVTLEFNALGASMLILDSSTGAVVASAMSPSFNLNDPPRNDLAMLNAYSKNKQIVDVYEPGSTFKIFTIAAAIDAGVTKLTDTFFCPGYRIVDGQRIKCWRTKGHGMQTLSEGVNNSCNCVFMDLALRLGTKKYYQYLRDFGFGQKTNIDFSGESRGILMNEKNVKNVDLARIGFGQAVAVTPMQLTAGVASVINGGTLYQPYFLQSATTYDNKEIYNRKPIVTRQILKKETCDTVKQLLINVVEIGSGKKAQVNGLVVGGKTGTAQKYKNGVIDVGKYVSSFVGFANNYVILLTIDEPKGYVYYGSLTAAPYVGQVLNKIANYQGINTNTDTEKNIELPNLIGKSYVQIETILKALNLNFETVGDGDYVVSTIPTPTTMVSKNDVILVRLE